MDSGMAALFRNFVFVSFPLALAALGYSLQGFRENPAYASDAYGLAPVVMYFVLLLAVGTLSICLAGLGKLFERQWSLAGGLKAVMRLLCYSPLLVSALLTGLVSAAYVLDSTAGVIACILSLISAASVVYWFSRKSAAYQR
jgi:ABC-type sugar transport system permease subunit